MNQAPERLKQLRQEHNLTQDWIASRINKTRATYCRYENGTLKPDIDTLTIIADIYKTSLDYLVGRYN